MRKCVNDDNDDVSLDEAFKSVQSVDRPSQGDGLMRVLKSSVVNRRASNDGIELASAHLQYSRV